MIGKLLRNTLVALSSLACLASCKKDVAVIKEQAISTQPEQAQRKKTAARSATDTVWNPTAGWTEEAFTYSIQKPFNLSVSERYSYDAATNTHTFWTYSTDSAHAQGSTTAPRSEMLINKKYTTGKHQFEADVCVSSGTVGACIMQVYGGETTSTSFMANIFVEGGGTVKRYNSAVIQDSAYDRWWHLNVVHDADNHTVQLYSNKYLVGTFSDYGDALHYFKCGVYGATKGSAKARFRNIRYWRKL